MGICRELGTAMQADTLDEVEFALREAIDLQLNEMAKITDGVEYLADNQVSLAPISTPLESGFAVAGSVLTT